MDLMVRPGTDRSRLSLPSGLALLTPLVFPPGRTLLQRRDAFLSYALPPCRALTPFLGALLLFVASISIPGLSQTVPPEKPVPLPTPQAATGPPQAAPAAGLVLKADFQEQIENRIVASGNVEIHYRELTLYADRVEFDTKTKDALAVGHVTLILPNEAFSAEKLAFNLETALGKIENVIGLVRPEYRYESAAAERTAPDFFSLGKSTITACAQPVPRWQFSASRANVKRDDYIEMWNMVLSIKSVPVFYLPYLKYPMKKDRATGFLSPQIGFSGRKGFSLSEQFYWNIARNMDATFSLDYYAAKGIGGGLEYRYKFAGGTGGQLSAYYFIYKTPTDPLSGPKPENAALLRWQHNQPLPGDINFVANVDYQSSFNFMREFDNNYMRALIYNRSSQVYLTKSWGATNLSLRLSRFETSFAGFNQSIIRDSLPLISFSTFKKKIIGPLYFSFNSTYHRWQYGYTSQFENGTQRKSSELYFGPTLSAPINALPWLNFNFSLNGNLSYYGNSIDLTTRQVVDKPLFGGNYVLTMSLIGPVFYRIFDLKNSTTRIKHIFEPELTYRYDSPVAVADRIVTTYGFYQYHQLVYGFTNHVLVKSDGKPREVMTWGLSQALYLSPEQSYMRNFRLEDGSIPTLSEISSFIRFFPLARLGLDVGIGYNTYKSVFSSIRAGLTLGSPADNFYMTASWYKSQNAWYGAQFYDRHQVSAYLAIKFPRLQLEALGELEYNISAGQLLYSGVAVVYHVQCLDLKLNARLFNFREKPEFQFRFTVGLGNIGKSGDVLGGRDF
jgi:LPS-assembly protein